MKYWLLTVLLAPGLAQATTYKCVAPTGEIVYTSIPCDENGQVVNLIDNRSMAPDDAGGAGRRNDASGDMLVLRLDEHHSYRTAGTVNGAPVTFVVDTGASGTTISQAVADAAGVTSCDPMGLAATANGTVERCTATVPELTFGKFHVKNLAISILPNMPVDGLLGMDVLSRLKMRQEDGVLYISGK